MIFVLQGNRGRMWKTRGEIKRKRVEKKEKEKIGKRKKYLKKLNNLKEY